MPLPQYLNFLHPSAGLFPALEKFQEQDSADGKNQGPFEGRV